MIQAHVQATGASSPLEFPKRRVARILLADTGLASRLTLRSILSTAGYAVSGAATTAEAIEKLDSEEYELVLADLRAESGDAGPGLLAYARQKSFRPATALLCSDMSEAEVFATEDLSEERSVRITDENVSYLLHHVAELIGQRAGRRSRRALARAS